MKKHLERMKSIVLTFLILLSFVLTGYLIFSTPSFEESSDRYLRPPYIGELKNNQQSVFQLAIPFQLIAHGQGKHALILPQDRRFDHLLDIIREAKLTNFTTIHPTHEQWKTVFQETAGVELNFLHDTSIGRLDSLFKRTVFRDQPLIKDQKQISRILFYIEPRTNKIWTWFISDQTQSVIQAHTDQIDANQLYSLINAATLTSKYALIPYPTNKKPPWEKENEKIPFSRMIYLPKEPFRVESLTYNLRQIDIEHMKQWLFTDPSVTPIQLNNNESLYMYNDPHMYNDQIITYNKQKNTMVYTNAPTASEKQTMLIREEIDEINQFIQRHRGWTNTYFLDQIETGDHANQYIFRLFVNGLPVYWKDSDIGNSPDTMQFQVVSGSINKYARSLYFLSNEMVKQSHIATSDQDQILSLMKQRGIHLNLVKRLYLSYQAIPQQGQKVLLTPCWVVETTNGKIHYLSTSSKEEN